MVVNKGCYGYYINNKKDLKSLHPSVKKLIDNSKLEIYGIKKILLIKNCLNYFSKMMVAEEIGQGNEISLYKLASGGKKS